jgi:hypothetical protein
VLRRVQMIADKCVHIGIADRLETELYEEQVGNVERAIIGTLTAVRYVASSPTDATASLPARLMKSWPSITAAQLKV